MDALLLDNHWDTVRAAMETTWADLTEDELDNVDGNIVKFYGLMHEKYGISRAECDAYLTALLNSRRN